MVKVPNRPPTPIEPRVPPGGPPSSLCPELIAEVLLEGSHNVRLGDLVSVQVRNARVRVLSNGQVVGSIVDPQTVEAILRCSEAGGAYQGRVNSLDMKTASVALEGRRR